ncbi:MAG: acetyltransferase [Aliiglaciecola sp.]
MQILFVHGMGRSPISGTPMLWRLRRHGHEVDVVAYLAATELFDDIVTRVKEKICQVAEKGDYILVGHSLGGVLLRAAIQQLVSLANQPKHLFLLGSPVYPPRLANKSQNELGFQLFSGDCGQLLASKQRLGSIYIPAVPTTAIVGTRGFVLTKKYFLDEPNDGVVSKSEVTHEHITNTIDIPVIHTFLPSSRKVSDIILNTIPSC